MEKCSTNGSQQPERHAQGFPIEILWLWFTWNSLRIKSLCPVAAKTRYHKPGKNFILIISFNNSYIIMDVVVGICFPLHSMNTRLLEYLNQDTNIWAPPLHLWSIAHMLDCPQRFRRFRVQVTYLAVKDPRWTRKSYIPPPPDSQLSGPHGPPPHRDAGGHWSTPLGTMIVTKNQQETISKQQSCDLTYANGDS